MHLWPDAARQLGLDISGAERVAAGWEKVALPVPRTAALRLGTVVLLGAPTGTPARAVTGPEAVALLFRNAYRFGLLHDLWGAELLAWATEVAARVRVVRVSRPGDGWTARAVAADVLAAAQAAVSPVAAA